MVGRTAPLKPADRARFAKLKQLRCVACQQLGGWQCCGVTEGHHIVVGNRRVGHQASVALGAYHHRGVPMNNYTVREMEALYGPSLATKSKRFYAQFGRPEELLRLTNEMLEEVA